MDPKALKALLKIMRDNGVLTYKTPEIELSLCSDAMFPKDKDKQEEVTNLAEEVKQPWENFPGGILTPEQLAYYSSGGSPDEDPYRDDN